MTRTFLAGALLGASLANFAHAAESSPQQRLAVAIEQLEAGRAADALKNLEALTKAAPAFDLGKRVYGELRLMLASAPAVTPLLAQGIGQGATKPQLRLAELAEEARLRLASEQAVPPEGMTPSNVLRLSAGHRYLILVDLPRAHLYLLENQDGVLKVVRHHYAAMGKNGYGKEVKGDLRTPVGVYHVTEWIEDPKLPELYGAGAFPVSYPNPWDVFQRRTGSGIWLHGVPRDTPSGSRPPRSSEGCVTMSNQDLAALKPYVQLGSTPVIFSDNVEWLDPAAQTLERDAWLNRLEEWRGRWAARDTGAYLEFYGQEFTTEGMNRSKFAAHKERVNAQKKFIEITLNDVDLYRYPGAGEPMILAEFMMDYRSDNFSSRALKQQFWRQEKTGEWRIFREENR